MATNIKMTAPEWVHPIVREVIGEVNDEIGNESITSEEIEKVFKEIEEIIKMG